MSRFNNIQVFMIKFADFPHVFKRLLKNKVYWLCVAANSFLLFGSIGTGSFGPKYMENVFNIPSWKANTILGKIQLVFGTCMM